MGVSPICWPKGPCVALIVLAATVTFEGGTWAQTAPGGGKTIGTATVVVRTVIGTHEATIRKLVVHDGVLANEIIQTDPDAASEIIFEDGTKISLGPNTQVTLDKFVYDPDPRRCAFFLTVVQGVFRFVTGTLPHQSYQITTPNGTIGIRG